MYRLDGVENTLEMTEGVVGHSGDPPYILLD